MNPDREPFVTTSPSLDPASTDPDASLPGADAGLSSGEPSLEPSGREEASLNEVSGPAEPATTAEPSSLLDASSADGAPDAVEALSPSVRRLVRQYDLDITGIHGTGPEGRIRVGDVIGMLGRTEGSRSSDARGGSADADETRGATPYRAESTTTAPAPAEVATPPITTVFECDLTRVLSHRKQQRRNNVEIMLTSYCVAACAAALGTAPELVVDGAETRRIGVLLASAEGELRSTLVEAPAAAPLDDRLRALDRQLRAAGDDDLGAASLLFHHYGMSGSLLATPTPLGAGHSASVGVGGVHRQIVVKSNEGDDAPKVAAVCYVTLTFLPDRIALHRANRFVAHVVRLLEQWPAE